MHAHAPRKRNAAASRRRILDATRHAFSETGYSHTGIRDISAAAGTSSTLLLRYFGSKAGLYEAALRDAMPADRLCNVSQEELLDQFPNKMIDHETSIQPLLMIAMASGAPEAAEVSARVFSELGVGQIADALKGRDTRLRALQISMLSFGMAFMLRHLPFNDLTEEDRTRARDWYVSQVRSLMRDPGPGTPN